MRLKSTAGMLVLLAFLGISVIQTQWVQGGAGLSYEGSFNLPSGSAWSDYYVASLVFVPDGATRPGWSGTPVAGPSLLLSYSYQWNLVEVNQFPALSKTVNGMGTAVWLQNNAGGTRWKGGRASDVDSAGLVWNSSTGSSGSNDGMHRNPNGHYLGGTNHVVLSADWYSSHPSCGVLRRGDGYGNNLTADGSNIGARFLINQRTGSAAWSGYVIEVTRTGTGENDVVKTNLFRYHGGTTDAEKQQGIQYVRDTGGKEWIIMWRFVADNARIGNHNWLDFYPPTFDGSVPQLMPSFSIDVGDILVKNGPGWMEATNTSWIKYVGVDWANSKLYVLEGTRSGSSKTQLGRVHVFTVMPAPEVETVGYDNVGENDADLIGSIADTDATDVICYWGTTDGGTDADAWENSYNLGPYAAPATITNLVSALDKGTVYFFRFFAANGTAGSWATNSLTFITQGANADVELDNEDGADNITENSAKLNGKVTGGVPSPNVWIYWGDTEGTDDKSSWNGTPIDVGIVHVDHDFYGNLNGLIANKTYWYRCYGSNENEEVWAPEASQFTTLKPTVSIGNASADEGKSGTTKTLSFTVTLSTASAVDVDVDFYTTDGTATTADNDYIATNGTLRIKAGQTTGTIEVIINGDDSTEANETFTVTLDSPVNATLGATYQGTGTINNDDNVFFIRGDGLGSDSNDGYTWATAWATLQKALNSISSTTEAGGYKFFVQASQENQAYDVAYRSGDISQTAGKAGWGNFSGGWENVDNNPVATGITRVQDKTNGGTKPGFYWSSTGSTHYQGKNFTFSRFHFSQVGDGIVLVNHGGLDESDIALKLFNTTIEANTNGVFLSHMGGAYKTATLTATNSVIKGGLSQVSGDGVFIYSMPRNMLIEKCEINSMAANGLRVSHASGGWVNGYDVTLRDSVFANCVSNGVEFSELSFTHWSKALRFFLDRSKLVDNGGHGFYRRHDGGNNHAEGGDRTKFFATNSICAGNGGHGIYLQGDDIYVSTAGVGGLFDIDIMNMTIAGNGGCGLKMTGQYLHGNSTTEVRNTIFAANGEYGLNLTHNRSVDGPIPIEDYNNFFGNFSEDIYVTGTGGSSSPDLGDNDLTIDPQFLGVEPEPWSPSVGNPLLDAGDPALYPPVDILGIERPKKAGPSIGAYESGPIPPAGILIILR